MGALPNSFFYFPSIVHYDLRSLVCLLPGLPVRPNSAFVLLFALLALLYHARVALEVGTRFWIPLSKRLVSILTLVECPPVGQAPFAQEPPPPFHLSDCFWKRPILLVFAVALLSILFPVLATVRCVLCVSRLRRCLILRLPLALGLPGLVAPLSRRPRYGACYCFLCVTFSRTRQASTFGYRPPPSVAACVLSPSVSLGPEPLLRTPPCVYGFGFFASSFPFLFFVSFEPYQRGSGMRARFSFFCQPSSGPLQGANVALLMVEITFLGLPP